jgi:hypothetical protein
MSWLIRMSFGIAAGFVLGNGWLVTNFLGLFVLLSIFVLTHVVAAMMSFRMISLIPHHLPKLVGFSSANRVDMDQFARDAAFVGGAKGLGAIQRGVQPSAIAGQGGQAQIGYTRALTHSSPGTSSTSGAGGGSGSAHMDTTLQATTDMSHTAPPQEA